MAVSTLMDPVGAFESKFSSSTRGLKLAGIDSRYSLVDSSMSKVKEDFEIHFQNARPAAADNATRDGQMEVVQSLEVVLLKSVVGFLMPSEDAGGIEAGMAGEFWKSIYSDQIAEILANSPKLSVFDNLENLRNFKYK